MRRPNQRSLLNALPAHVLETQVLRRLSNANAARFAGASRTAARAANVPARRNARISGVKRAVEGVVRAVLTKARSARDNPRALQRVKAAVDGLRNRYNVTKSELSTSMATWSNYKFEVKQKPGSPFTFRVKGKVSRYEWAHLPQYPYGVSYWLTATVDPRFVPRASYRPGVRRNNGYNLHYPSVSIEGTFVPSLPHPVRATITRQNGFPKTWMMFANKQVGLRRSRRGTS